MAKMSVDVNQPTLETPAVRTQTRIKYSSLEGVHFPWMDLNNDVSVCYVSQPGVCRYGRRLECCYGWKKNGEGQCEGRRIRNTGQRNSFTQTIFCQTAITITGNLSSYPLMVDLLELFTLKQVERNVKKIKTERKNEQKT